MLLLLDRISPPSCSRKLLWRIYTLTSQIYGFWAMAKEQIQIYGRNCIISYDAKIGDGTRIGNFVLVRDSVIIGKGCIVGSYVSIEGDAQIGNNVSLQTGCYLTRGIIIEDDVFCGPRMVTMNDKVISYRRPTLAFEPHAPRILRGARIGGGCVLLPGITIGENAFVGAGTVVTRDVADRMIVAGTPSRVIGTVPHEQII